MLRRKNTSANTPASTVRRITCQPVLKETIHKNIQIKAHFLHAAKMKEVIILPEKTQGVQENKNRSYRMKETSNTTNNKNL
jgi:hypothetical protein